MRVPLIIMAALLATGAAQAATDRSPEARLAKAIEGRVEGAPVDCLNQRDIRSTQIIDGIGIIYETSGRRLYVNRPTSGASSLRWGQVLVTDTHSSQLCSIDIVRLYDTSSRIQSGFLGLGKFVPYDKPEKSK
jgi:hypothetical protein